MKRPAKVLPRAPTPSEIPDAADSGVQDTVTDEDYPVAVSTSNRLSFTALPPYSRTSTPAVRLRALPKNTVGLSNGQVGGLSGMIGVWKGAVRQMADFADRRLRHRLDHVGRLRPPFSRSMPSCMKKRYMLLRRSEAVRHNHHCRRVVTTSMKSPQSPAVLIELKTPPLPLLVVSLTASLSYYIDESSEPKSWFPPSSHRVRRLSSAQPPSASQ